MRVLVACEFSGVVREAFRRQGHEAWSCDLLAPADGSPYHLQADVIAVLYYPLRVLGGRPRWMIERRWDLLIAHPPCTRLANSGVRWLYGGKGRQRDPKVWEEMEDGATFFKALWDVPYIPKVCVENPIMHGHGQAIIGAGPSQIIQPWQFGHGETKATCLWLRGLPELVPTKVVEGRRPRVHFESPGPDRWKRRSVTYEGIAEAMASQWGEPL